MTATENDRWKKLRLVALGGLTLLGSTVLCMGMLTSSAAWYTSRSQFCSSCHIMTPYYTSWQHSTHSDVACIKCHFAPGIGEKVRGKMQGLVQLITYVTRSEGPRPVAEVSDASCLRSGCHESRSLPGPIQFHDITFDHAPHLGVMLLDSARKGPGVDSKRPATESPDEAHRTMTLRCTSCHGQSEPSQHMVVSLGTCFLCHFKERHFNEGAGACTRCHQIPEDQFELGGGMTFTHDLVYENGTDCKSCHGELNQGDGLVSRVRCQVCHNREIDLEKIVDPELMHDLHVTEHKVDCMDCHEAITHSLADHDLTRAASDCASCHPGHHSEQVNMLMGTGGLSIPEHTAGMTASRVQCLACHSEKQVTSTGTVVWKASASVCTACHTSSEAGQLQLYQDGVRESLADLESALQRITDEIEIAELRPEELAEAQVTRKKLAHDLDFLNVGNGIHNIHYATTLTRALFAEAGELCRKLGVQEPTKTLPDDLYQID